MFLAISIAGLLCTFYTIFIIPEDVRNRWYLDNFLLPTNWILALLAGLGLWVSRPFFIRGPWRQTAWVILLAALPLQQFLSNFSMSNEQNQMLRYDYGENLMEIGTPKRHFLFPRAMRIFSRFIIFKMWPIKGRTFG